MVISNNRRPLVTPTPSVPNGMLRTIGNATFEGANQLFLGFKPAAVCKESGFLRVTGSGYYDSPFPTFEVNLSIEFSRPGVQIFNVLLLSLTTTKEERLSFTFTADIPVGTQGNSYTNWAFVTTHVNNTSTIYQPGAYISADIDDVWTASLRYSIFTLEPVPNYGEMKVLSLVTEYLEN